MDVGPVIAGGLVLARRDAAVVLDAIHKSLGQIPRFVFLLVPAAFRGAFAARRDDRFGAALADDRDQFVGVVALVTDDTCWFVVAQEFRSPQHIMHWTRTGLAEAELVGLVFWRPESLAALTGELPGVAGWTSLLQTLRDSNAEAWIVACSASLHVSVTTTLLESGKTVLLEKPRPRRTRGLESDHRQVEATNRRGPWRVCRSTSFWLGCGNACGCRAVNGSVQNKRTDNTLDASC